MTVVAPLLALLAGVQLHAWGMALWGCAVLGAAQTLPLVLARRHPTAAALGCGFALGVSSFLGYGQGRLGWPWPAASIVAMLVLLWLARPFVGALVVAGVVVPAPLPVGLRVVATLAVVLVVAGPALVAWRRVRLRADAVAVERRRLARELHDSVGHHLSLIALAGSVASTRELAVQGLAELRATVRGLRAPPSDLSALVARARRAGVSVTLSGPGTVPEAAYRVVQEAVTNAVRHAPGSPVHVDVSTSASGRTAVRVASGLDGLRDRVTAAGGTFSAGVAQDGRFVVEAELPG